MRKNIFGNLNDWGVVLDKLADLVKNKELDHYQDEVIRLLRFDQNWRLREAAIEALPSLEDPSSKLVREVLLLVKRKDLYYDARILATDCLGTLVSKIFQNKSLDKDILNECIKDIRGGINILLDSPEPPKFHSALQKSIDQIKSLATSK